MNVDENTVSGVADRLDELPSFDLDYVIDEEEEPAEVTVFPKSDEFDIHTNWITVDISSTVPLDDVV